MKYIYTLLAVCCLTVATAQNHTISPVDYRNVVLKEVGDSLQMSFDIVIPALVVKSRQSLVIVPELKSNDGNSYTYGYVQLDGKNRYKTLNRTAALKKLAVDVEMPYIAETVCGCEEIVIHYAKAIPYKSWMDEGFLTRTERIIGCARNSATHAYNFGVNVEIGYRPPAIPPVAYIAPKPIVKERNEEGKAYLDFQKGQHTIDPTFRRNPQELMRIMDIIHKTTKDGDVTLHDVSIVGYASPDGNADFNEKLAGRRATSFMEYVQKMSGIPAATFKVRPQGEDWAGLREFVEEMELNQKEKVLAIIDNDAALDRKEQQLKALGAPYHKLLADIFPALRRVEYNIRYTVKDYSMTEAQKLLNSDPSKLNSYELYLLVKLYEEGSGDWNEIIKLTAELYPDEVEANINAAAVYINTGDYAKAKQCLDKVRHLPEAVHNLGIYEEMERQGLIN
ncbi:MAG: DUF3868 domain-containing protein [Tannerellaceae bacterium]|nr:DUF3868 domain-containing protein [Tannerellaceae bacterium]